MITFNGQPLPALELPLAVLTAGGELHITPSPIPAGPTAQARARTRRAATESV